jgi:hypothetical protein
MPSPSRPLPGHPVIDWLSRDPTLSLLADQAQRLIALQRDVDAALAPLKVRVIALDQGRLVLGTPHASAAARLRQREPSLVRHLASRGWPVRAVQFRPPREPSGPQPAPRRTKSPPLPAAVEACRVLAATTRHPELARALTRFSRRHSPD